MSKSRPRKRSIGKLAAKAGLSVSRNPERDPIYCSYLEILSVLLFPFRAVIPACTGNLKLSISAHHTITTGFFAHTSGSIELSFCLVDLTVEKQVFFDTAGRQEFLKGKYCSVATQTPIPAASTGNKSLYLHCCLYLRFCKYQDYGKYSSEPELGDVQERETHPTLTENAGDRGLQLGYGLE